MNILNKLSIRNLKLNKKRTISTCIGIILSVALICAVGTISSSFQETLVQSTINNTGYWHLQLMNVKDDQFEVLKNNRDIQKINEMIEVGYGKLKGIKNEDKPYLKLYSMNQEVFTNLKLRLIEGRFPQNNKEVIIAKHLYTNGSVNKKIGDKIKIKVGERKTIDGFELYTANPYREEEEKIVNTKEYEFTIVGIMERPHYMFEDYGDPGYSIITTDLKEGKRNIFLALKDVNDYKNSFVEILGAKNYEEIQENSGKFSYINFHKNDELLRWQVLSLSDTSYRMLQTVIGIVIMIILFTSIFCIRNSFAISTTEKIKMYGMLASVGTTRKQIRRNVISEAMGFGLIGIPCGILCGVVASYILVQLINIVVGDFLFINGTKMVLKPSFISMIGSALLGCVTIYFSARSSAKMASRITPIESLRGNQDIKIKAKKLKTPRVIKKVFGMGGVIAYKNLKRSKKKYRTTVISLTLSIFIFITMNVVLTHTFGMAQRYIKDLDYNVVVGLKEEESFTKENMEKILHLENIEKYTLRYHLPNYASVKITDMSKVIDKTQAYYDEEKDQIVQKPITEKYLSILALDQKSYKEYAEKLGIDAKKTKGMGILYDLKIDYDEKTGKSKEKSVYQYKKGNQVEGTIEDKDFKITLAEVTQKPPIGFEDYYTDGGILIVNVDDFKEKGFRVYDILIQSNNPDQLEANFNKEFSKLSFDNLDAIVRQQRSLDLITSIFIYGFIAVITLIGVTNIFNSITSNVELRQKEFAMLKSIGMTQREFNNMIHLETVFYSTKSLLYGIIFGLLGSVMIYKAFSIKLDMGIYIPIKPILISICAVFILVFIIMNYSVKKVNKQNIIETIRKEII